MRLTLRTLLAYLDDAVEPGEAQDLAKKIEESEFAAGLVQRLRTVTKKPRLPAPKIDGKGLGNDANTVAEYIESTLTPEKIGEFERLCIESDQHLAEVAATHQILTLVLGRPSKVSQELRERVYNIPKEPRAAAPIPTAEAPRKQRAPETDASPAEPVVASLKGPLDAAAEEESTKEVPEYLRAAKLAERKWMFLAITAGVGFLLAAVVLRAMGPFDSSHPIARMFGSQPVVVVPTPPVPPPNPKPEPEPEPMPNPNEVTEPVVEPVEKPMPPEPGPEPMPVDPAEVTPAEPVVKPMPPEPKPSPTEVVVVEKPMPPEVVVVPVPVKPEVQVDVGRYISDEQVLARFDTQTKLWTRVKAKSLLMSGEQLIALPVFRPQIALPSGVQVTVLGESHFQMLPPGDMGAPRLQMNLGKITVITDGVPGGKLGLSVGVTELLVTLNDADSLVAVDVRRYLPPGSDPQNDKATIVVEVFAVNGHVDLSIAGGETVELRPQHVMTIIAGEAPNVTGPFLAPAWVDVRGERDIDREAARALEKELAGERTLPVALTEALQDRRVEVRSLAARSLAHLGEFSGLMDELSDVRQATFWAADLDTLKMLLCSSSESAARVMQAVDRRYGNHSATIYRMLGGFSPEQLKGTDGTNGTGNDLIKALESPEMELRVVAAYTLERIVGTNYAYRAAGRPETNRLPITRFKELQSGGKLVYAVTPSPRSEFKPLP